MVIPKVEYAVYKTPLGWVGAATSERGLAAVVLPQANVDGVKEKLSGMFDNLDECRNDLLKGFSLRLESYFAGEEVDFRGLDLDLFWATPFTREVYGYVRNIPYGKVATYKEVALAIGRDGACRAVGGAMKRNRLPLIIPCHRVVGSKGLGGFTGAGLEVKEKLINLEKAGRDHFTA